ncbi:hypothetical protein IM660_06165 [Ruania alkalisoli]|uniref:Uncharacterized protein n=1 Tax=Ruania alkalisoli TaxID=2779775 RepID=A0A7M1SXT5_9MICO|nr:hypothetical protein [Ruania alkalisoli]QOR71847.1 hypothetical protein IM660_06165 [Ruania alkalisoli]
MTNQPYQVHEYREQTARAYVSAGRFKREVVTVRGGPGAVEVTGAHGTITTVAGEGEILQRGGDQRARLRVFEMPPTPKSLTYGPVRHDFHGIPRWARTLRTVWIVVLVLALLTLNGIYLGEIGANVPLPWAAAMVAAIAIGGLPLLLSIRATRRGLADADPVEHVIKVFEASGMPMEDEATASVRRGSTWSGAGPMPVFDYTLRRFTRAGFVGSQLLPGFLGFVLGFAPLAAIAFGISRIVPDESWRTVAAVVIGIGQPICAALIWHLLLWWVARTRYHSPLKERAVAYYRRPQPSTAVWLGIYLLLTGALVLAAW